MTGSMDRPIDFTGGEPFGVVAMAAYKPDEELFLRQLRSIRDQSYSNFLCLISVDGNDSQIRDFVATNLGDPRFKVLGFENRLGFYGNFERVLSQVPEEAVWVALSDQDDYWYPDKLSRLLPHLDDHVLVSGQARVVDVRSGRVLAASTNRRNVPLLDLIIQNQVTGGQTVFRSSLLRVGLPFPRLHTPTQVHDHWLAVCAAASGSVHIVDDIVQDYVQHGGNTLGEVKREFNPLRSFKRLFDIADRFQGGHSPGRLFRACSELSYGWRRVLVESSIVRLPDSRVDLLPARKAFGSNRTWRHTVAALLAGARRGNVEPPCLIEFIAGVPGEIGRPRRR